MLFNSLSFLIFLPIVFIVYWSVVKKSLSLQNLFILIVSYVFYGWWDYRFLALIAASTLVDYSLALAIKKQHKKATKKMLLLGSLLFNLGLLCFFKYFNFFIESWVNAFQAFGIQQNISTLYIILPVGISFYTFQTLSYTIDVYREKLKPTKNLIQFAAYVSFFPQLVAGPIERATRLLPQFTVTRTFDSKFAISGISLIVWGLFKKIVVADNCAFFVDQIFNSPGGYSSSELFMGVVLFGFQIYGDFSGYSDIAIGVARLFGFSLMTNFTFPYFSRDIAEFWRRWHISLSTWFRDYVYIPLGGSRGSKLQQIRNVSIVFLVSGFWHGANWTFIIWGAIHALLFLPLLLANKNRAYSGSFYISVRQIPSTLLTFLLVMVAWVFFRADTVQGAFSILIDIFSLQDLSLTTFFKSSKALLFSCIIAVSIAVMLVYEFKTVQKNKQEVTLSIGSTLFILLLTVFMGVFKNPADFIYFQF